MEKNITQKKLIRETIINRRSSLSSLESRRASDHISDTVIRIIESGNYKTVLAYSHFRGEVSTDSIIKYCLNHEICVGLPVSRPDHTMDFYQIHSLNDLSPGYQGILEPDRKRCELCKMIGPSIVIVPGTAFDRSGRRLGYGGGFYDRYFLRYPDVFKVGIAYDLQIADQLPYEKHDIKMDMVITESGILYKK